ncbi:MULTISPECIES: DUF1330 domain-containing protein [unclassified Shewanella]|uniref:DUF1330 domain-containing protein n=1 Tax=unclassified Shewanella TaxID=196818 RepID=UPI001E63B5EF|nr:DUF1330 domain-containing protein [Shewanella sp. 10N.7]MCC4834336.1 DUF1330 domain-containing protein [Shewanella sp. 10N.7]
MGFQRIMALHVHDELEYQAYRDAMLPILHFYGGDFGYDFAVSEVLKSKTNSQINRVFTIDFPSEEVMNAFFSDESYLSVKQRHFNASVTSSTVIGLHETD